MKKIFTLLASVAVALCANAQTSGFFDVTEALSEGQVVTSVPDIKVTYGGHCIKGDGTETADSNGNPWKAALKKKAFSYGDYKFTYYSESWDNARGELKDGSYLFSPIPVYGSFVKYEPECNGKLIVYYYVADKINWFTAVNKENPEGENWIATGDAKIYNEDGTDFALTDDYKASTKGVGVLVADVKGGDTYYLCLNGSKLGVGGFAFESTGEKPAEEPETPVAGDVLTGVHTFNTTFCLEPFGLQNHDIKTDLGRASGTITYDFDTWTLTNMTIDNIAWNITMTNASVTSYEKDGETITETTVPNVNALNATLNFNKGEGFSGSGYYLTVDATVGKSMVFTKDYKDAYRITGPKVAFDGYSKIENVNDAKNFIVNIFIQPTTAEAWDATTSSWVSKGGVYNLYAYIPGVKGSLDDTTSIEEIEAVVESNENAPVEYYNLQGIRIAEPVAGQIVIRRQGTDVKKIVVR